MLRRLLFPIIGSTLALLLVSACGNQATPAPEFSVSTEPNVRVEQSFHGEAAVIDIFSESGIGNADFALTQGAMPAVITLRLHTKGLEELRVRYADTEIGASVSSQPGNAVSETINGQPITPESPYWLDIAITPPPAPNANAIPLAESFFRIALPANFTDSGATGFSVAWVDFYR